VITPHVIGHAIGSKCRFGEIYLVHFAQSGPPVDTSARCEASGIIEASATAL